MYSVYLCYPCNEFPSNANYGPMTTVSQRYGWSDIRVVNAKCKNDYSVQNDAGTSRALYK